MPITTPERQLAEVLCRAFFSWHLQHDHRTLARLGDGRLEIDLLRVTCRHRKNHIPTLVIVDSLVREYRRFLDVSGLAVDTVKTIVLSVDLEFDEHAEQQDRSVWWFGEHSGFVGCKAEMNACVETKGGGYTAKQERRLEWPKRATG